jgi:hypothetical protein
LNWKIRAREVHPEPFVPPGRADLAWPAADSCPRSTDIRYATSFVPPPVWLDWHCPSCGGNCCFAVILDTAVPHAIADLPLVNIQSDVNVDFPLTSLPAFQMRGSVLISRGEDGEDSWTTANLTAAGALVTCTFALKTKSSPSGKWLGPQPRTLKELRVKEQVQLLPFKGDSHIRDDTIVTGVVINRPTLGPSGNTLDKSPRGLWLAVSNRNRPC